MFRSRKLFAAVALAALSLTACGGGGSTDTGSSSPAAAEQGPRTITDATGAQLTVPAKPKNVVALAETDLDAAIALGVTPIGASKSRQGDSVAGYLASKVPGIKLVGEIVEPDLDAIAALDPKPDIILYGHFIEPDPAQIADLNAIAPTVVTSLVKDDWKASLKGVANALNLSAKADEVLKDHDKKVADTKGALGANATAEVSLVRWNPQGPTYLQKQHFASTVVGELGLKRPQAQQTDGTGPSDPVSLEKLDVLDADWLFLGTLNADGAGALKQAEANPTWTQLKAVQAKHVVTVDGVPWTSRGGPVAAGVVLDDIRKALGK
ncbi:iron-siderophore ABC transporter substrate-binding protein [Actinosynnema sp. NPDC047251]|uniref:ABC-type transporter, substrate-binding lipoprotein n=1 Tax=Saccharothrix espanaensis (strain ATCC 51144 / DSM 44229 / JCM 9112 / NBRC 15066 / NRRL 15764) TaxID=1179773 RepID=K0JXD2_SACES|nr:iron-siderophore ABC transporter substrate-binding protein [Saccharothrix espanaensis]CCH30007.1 ABC-type transporter, substrate-binding lipoprotein [Saccharothrix espanaensis DSM 44229]